VSSITASRMGRGGRPPAASVCQWASSPAKASRARRERGLKGASTPSSRASNPRPGDSPIASAHSRSSPSVLSPMPRVGMLMIRSRLTLSSGLWIRRR